MTIYTTGASDLPAVAERNRNSLMLQSGHKDTNPLFVWDGVHSGLYIAKTTGMGFVIGAGRAAVNAASSADGTLSVVLTGDEPGAFEPNDTAADRRDLVVLKAYPDNPSTTGVKVEVVKGVPGATEWPATPAGAISLYGVIIGAGVSAANGGWNRAWTTDLRNPIGVPQFIEYTPTWSNFGNLGSNYVSRGRYRVDGDKVSCHVSLEAGAGAVMGDNWLHAFSLPIPSKGGWVYSGLGSLHHPNTSGLAYQLHVLSAGGGATIHAIANSAPMGALVAPGSSYAGYPFAQGTTIFCNLEYFIDPQ